MQKRQRMMVCRKVNRPHLLRQPNALFLPFLTDLEHEQQQLEALKRKNNPMLMERDGWNRRALAAEHKLSQLQEEMTRKAAASKAEKDDLRVKVQELTAQLANTATEDMAFKDATNEAEKDELRAKILGLEVELASATTERSGAFGNVANRQVHNSENLQASPELHVKAKNATIKSEYTMCICSL